MAIIIYNILGSQTANLGDISPLVAKVDDIVENMIYVKLNINPIPMFTPIPPFTFRDESDIPMDVNINAAKMDAIRPSYYIWNGFTFEAPRSCCFLIYRLSSGVVINSAS